MRISDGSFSALLKSRPSSIASVACRSASDTRESQCAVVHCCCAPRKQIQAFSMSPNAAWQQPQLYSSSRRTSGGGSCDAIGVREPEQRQRG